MPVSNCLFKRIFSYIIIFFFLHKSHAQTLIINEVSNGPSGNQEYVELVVIDSSVIYDCNSSVPPCIDIRGWIFDDNSGYHGPFGVATGAVRFSFDPLWSCIPVGTIIVIYNSADPNPSLPADDISLSDGNCSLVIPISSSLFEQNSTTPGAVACSYPSGGWTAGGSWTSTVFANGGDCARIVDLSGCEVFSLCWSDANQNSLIYFASGGTGTDNVWYFNDSDPYNQVNWTEGCADVSTCGSNVQTPGAPNNPLNAAYISQFNNDCLPLTPVSISATSTNVTGCACDGAATATASGSIPGYSYSWLDSSFLSTGITSANATGLCAGTYYVIATSSIGCADTATVVINPDPSLPVVSVPADTVVCSGSTIPSAIFTSSPPGATFSWTNTETSIGLAVSGNGNISSFTAVNNGTSPVVATVSVTGTNAGCAGSPSVFTITVNPLPEVTIPLSLTVCPGDTVPQGSFTSTIPGTNFLWVNSDTSIGLPGSGTGNTPAFIAANPGTSPIVSTISITPEANSCTGTPADFSITVHSTPVMDPVADIVACSNDTVNPVSFSSAEAGATFAWSNSDTAIGLSMNGIGNISPFTAINGGGSPVLSTLSVIPFANGCTGLSEIFTITVLPLPVITLSSDTICEGESAVLSANGATIYNWSPSNDLSSSSGSSVTATPIATTTYLIAGTDSNGCSDSASTTLTVITPPDASIIAAGPFCSSDSAFYLAAVDEGGIWSGTGITDSIAGIFDPAVAGGGSHLIQYTLYGICSDTSGIFIDIISDANASILPAGPYCFSASPDTLSSAEPGGTWSGTGITDSITGVFDPAVTGVGNFIITYLISGNCGDAQSITIAVTDSADASIIPVNPFCSEDGAVNLASAEPGGTWSGNGITDSVSGTFDPTAAGAGAHTIYYIVPGSCGDTGITVINVYQQSDASVLPAGPFCINDNPVPLSSLNSGGTWSGTGITDPVNGIFSPSGAGSGTHIITYSISGVCGDIQNLNIIVNPQTDATINAAGPFCENDIPSALSAVIPGGTWSGSGITDPNTGMFDPSVAGSGNHVITYISPGNCSDTSELEITINELPYVAFQADNTSGCAPLDVDFSCLSFSPGMSVQWDFGNGSFSSDTSTATSQYTISGCYDVSLSITSPDGCTNTSTLADMVCVADQPEADFTFSSPPAGIFNSEILFTNLSSGATNYYWDFPGSESSIETNPSFLFASEDQDTFLVCLNAYNSSGCMDSVCRNIIITGEFLLYVPNCFTPDNDGLNDEFIPFISGHDPSEFEFILFDRWGEMIFYSESDETGWDGFYNGILCKQDVYVWKIKAKNNYTGERKVYTGHVTLLR